MGVRLRIALGEHNLVTETEFPGFPGVHPRFAVHEMAQFGTGLTSLDLVGVNDALFYLIQQLDGFPHFIGIAHGCGEGIVDHHHTGGAHADMRARHGDHAGSACRHAVDLHSDIMGIIHEHGVDLTGRDAIAAGAVDVKRDRAVPGEKLLLEHGRGHVVRKPALLSDHAFQIKGAGLIIVFDPVPEMTHGDHFLSRERCSAVCVGSAGVCAFMAVVIGIMLPLTR